MELILWLLVSYYLADHLITDTAYAVRGLDPPRHKERMARLQAGGQDGSAVYRSGRNGASRFFAEAWHDAWDDAHTKRRELREKRQAKTKTQPDGTVDTPGALRPQESGGADGNVIQLDRRAQRPARIPTRQGGNVMTLPRRTGLAAPANGRASLGADSDAWESMEYTHCEHCPADDGPGGTVRHRPDVDPPGDLCDECYGRRRAAEADPEGVENQTVACSRCGAYGRRYDMDLVALYGGGAVLTCPECINLAGVKRPRRYTEADPTAEPQHWPDAEAPEAAPAEVSDPGPADPTPQPNGSVEVPGALRPQPGGSAWRTPGSLYPSLFTTPEAWDAHHETLPAETRRLLAELDTRIERAYPQPVAVSLEEEAAILQARGYSPEVARTGAEEIFADARKHGGSVSIAGFRRLPGEPGGVSGPVGRKSVAAGGTAVKESQEGTQMTTMTSDNATSQPTGETAGLGSAIRFATGMANSMRDAAARTETSIASLTGSEVGPGPIAVLQQAMEAAANAAAAYDAAKAELEKQLSVKEAYDATPDAGNKQFLQND